MQDELGRSCQDDVIRPESDARSLLAVAGTVRECALQAQLAKTNRGLIRLESILELGNSQIGGFNSGRGTASEAYEHGRFKRAGFDPRTHENT